jgi:DNA (cytosine-5)-methyltransferase 1
MKLTLGSLFSGIGGLELGLERTGGFRTVWQVEHDPLCQSILAKHWPDCGRWDDVRTFPPAPAADWRCDVICGGFPCQDISWSNFKGAGLAGEKSGLWRDYARIIGELQPRYVLIENVPAITFRGLGTVLNDLSDCGYDAEWNCIPAAAVGAPQLRRRIFVLAYPNGKRCQTDWSILHRPRETVAQEQEKRVRLWPGQRVACPSPANRVRWLPNAELGRVADGVPEELDRFRMLGNSVVPQVAEWIGERVLHFNQQGMVP